jgi:hypothetical protein
MKYGTLRSRRYVSEVFRLAPPFYGSEGKATCC